jgi:hypothetical protein
LVSLVVGSLMPAYTDPVAAEQILSGSECEPGIPNTDENLRCDNERWQASLKALRTSKWSLVDGGGGLLASALMMFVFLWLGARKSWTDLATPKRSLLILVLASLSWLMQIPAYELFYMTEAMRGHYPHWADSIAIPIFETEEMVLRLFLPYIGIWLIFVVGARLPVSIFSSVPGRPLVNAFWTGATALLLLPIGLCLIGAILTGPIVMVPFFWLTLWLILCARAAALTRHRPSSA